MAMYSPQSLHRWGITHSESMERLAYGQGKLTGAPMSFFRKYILSIILDSMAMLFTIYIKDKTISQIPQFEQNNLNIYSK